jgi:hypothetical protein
MSFPLQEPSKTTPPQAAQEPSLFDMRDYLTPSRLTIVMWDQAFLLRHVPGGSFEHYDRVLDEAIERGYNTLRLDPLPQLVDLAHPEMVFSWPDPHTPYMPWGWDRSVEGPVGLWLLEFMEALLHRGLSYTLSAWWFTDQSTNNPFSALSKCPHTHLEAAELWRKILLDWKARFGFKGLVYVDIANEVPYFLPGYLQTLKDQTGADWSGSDRFTSAQVEFLAHDLNAALSLLQREFPELRFTASIHGDTRWLEVPVQFDCLDVHFYADMDPRWTVRTRFPEVMPVLFTDASWHKEFSDRCTHTHKSMAPMLRARQRSRLAAFADWGSQNGMPLTTSESWASWYYIDSQNLDWGWLLDWAAWSVEDALEFKMWGWTPHNYCQPQFQNWQDVLWHRRLTEKFLHSP